MSSAGHNIPTFLFHHQSLNSCVKGVEVWNGLTKKNRILSHFSRSHEHFVIICLVLYFPARGVEVGKVRLQDVRPKFGQISTPMSTTKIIKHRDSTVGYEKWGILIVGVYTS